MLIPPQVHFRAGTKVSLAWLLIVPFVVQVAAVVGFVGYSAHRQGQRSLTDMTDQLMDSVGTRVDEKVVQYLAAPQLMNHQLRDAVGRGELKLELDQFNPVVDRYLLEHMQLFPQLTWISVGTELHGSSVGVWRPGPQQPLQMSIAHPGTGLFGQYFATNAQGQRTKLLKVEKPVFDARTRPWYQQGVSAKQTVWAPIYPGFTPGTIFLACSQPLYNPQGKLVGASGIDISLKGIQTFLAEKRNQITPNSQVLLIERSGMLVATSSDDPSFELLRGQKPRRLSLLESKTPLIVAAAKSLPLSQLLTVQQPQQFEFEFQNAKQMVRVQPLSESVGLEWLIVVVVPESDVMGQIQAGTQQTVLLGLGAVGAVSLLNALLSRLLMRPIGRLNQALQEMSQGDLGKRIPESRIRELSGLTQSFNQMSQEVQSARQQLQNYSRSLETAVRDRTFDLQQEIQSRIAAEQALQSANAELEKIAYLDGLTQIPNRRRLNEALDQYWRDLLRNQQPLGVILCDVDFFKRYNDFYGHQQGDRCLQLVAQAIQLAVQRPMDLVARYGGEEFAILLPNTTKAGAIAVAQRIQQQVQQLNLPHANSETSDAVTLSLGLTCQVPTLQSTPESLLAQADSALYEAKEKGRNQVGIYPAP
jgi:diguanylate cyclase (GGDEF)-like protein